jgi:hypothetical protein
MCVLNQKYIKVKHSCTYVNFWWASDCYLTPNEQFFSWIMARTSYNWGDDEYVHFVLDQSAELHLYSASSQKQQSVGRHVVIHGHIILTQSLTPDCLE